MHGQERVRHRLYVERGSRDGMQVLTTAPCSPLSHRFVIASMWNEAAQHIEGWKTQRPAPPDAGKVGRLADEL